MPTYITSEDFIDVSRLGQPLDFIKDVPPSPDSSVTDEIPLNKQRDFVPNLIESPIAPFEVPSPPILSPIKTVEESEEADGKIPFMMMMSTYIFFALLALLAHGRELFRRVFPKRDASAQREGYAPLMKDFDAFWQRHFYRRISDCWNRPIDSRPSRVIGVMERVSRDHNTTLELTGRVLPCVNLSSYNYLGFAEDTPGITRRVLDAMDRLGVAACSAPQLAGQNAPVARLERAIADFLGKDDALVCGMGFGTNFRGLPALFGRDTLVLSDALNHASLVHGVRMSGATVRVFPHGQYDALEAELRAAVVRGRPSPAAHTPWARLVIIVEGIYSMEGAAVDLARVVALKRRYGALLFVDEAHSIGAMGRTGRGITEAAAVSPAEVDVLMGTFTKSFGSIGGYMAGSRAVVAALRARSSVALHCDALAPPCAEQALAVLEALQGGDGSDVGRKRIRQLRENARFLRHGLRARGFTVLGADASPVVPVMVYHPAKLAAVSRACVARGLALVMVGYPATPLLEGRVRMCVSAAHTREDLQFAMDVMEEVAREVHIKFRTAEKNAEGRRDNGEGKEREREGKGEI